MSTTAIILLVLIAGLCGLAVGFIVGSNGSSDHFDHD
jgi:hypothetical protein